MINKISFILVHPQMGENIGAAARAMANFGISDLRLVAPRDGWPNPKAIDMAAGAFDHMPEPQVFKTLGEAIGDLHKTYATTARARDMVKPVFTPDAATEDGFKILTQDGAKIGFVFGPERTGLENDDLSLCNAIINVPTNSGFSSLNLGQCVLLISYALSQRLVDAVATSLPMGDSAPVSQNKLEGFLGRLNDELDAADFFKSSGSKVSIARNIRNIFVRGNLSDQEVRTLHGTLTALIKKSEPS